MRKLINRHDLRKSDSNRLAGGLFCCPKNDFLGQIELRAVFLRYLTDTSL